MVHFHHTRYMIPGNDTQNRSNGQALSPVNGAIAPASSLWGGIRVVQYLLLKWLAFKGQQNFDSGFTFEYQTSGKHAFGIVCDWLLILTGRIAFNSDAFCWVVRNYIFLGWWINLSSFDCFSNSKLAIYSTRTSSFFLRRLSCPWWHQWLADRGERRRTRL